MALQDLTPQLRTRLSRMERAVGWFVILAMALLMFGFVYFVYHTAERKGWFLTKAPYYTYTDRATGLKLGDPVMLMGLDVGQITRMEPMKPYFHHNIYVEFEIKDPYYGYLWTQGSRAKVTTADLLGKRVLEVTKGTGGYATYIFHPLRAATVAELQSWPDLSGWVLAQEVRDATETNLLAKAKTPLTNLTALATAGCTNLVIMNTKERWKSITGIWNDHEGRYDSYTNASKPYELVADESAAVTERLEKLVGDIEQALPNFLRLTNQLATVLSNSASLTSNLNAVALGARPAVSNLTKVTAQLDHPGALGEWLLPTNINRQLEGTLGNADATLASANTNLTALAENLGRSLDSLANLTSNLNGQVEANTNVLSEISRAIVDADSFVQGLKRHWLLRSAFRTRNTNAPPAAPSEQLRSPKDRRER
jgi:ABC-type transporter Mla subunit MlaD